MGGTEGMSPDRKTGAQVLAEGLIAKGAQTMFGIPGFSSVRSE